MIDIRFGENTEVIANVRGFEIVTDQPVAAGGRNSAPDPFTLFLTSVGTCAGYYTLKYCKANGIDPAAVRLKLTAIRDIQTRRMTKLRTDVHLPEGVDPRHHEGIRVAIDECAVKKAMQDMPVFEVRFG
ncbi:MAG TPA: OsmC family protein [Rhodocyclaceae bacterium]|nr:OsmC family protein [Rhodocyclaceae bacterium]